MEKHFETQLIDKQDLTAREAEVLLLVCSACSDKEIARALGLSIWTVIRYIDAIRKKMDVQQTELNARMALMRTAVLRGIVRLGCVIVVAGSVAVSDDPAAAARVRLVRPGVSRVRTRYD
jgi:DNA-binding CsgD family transcriptional regulator